MKTSIQQNASGESEKATVQPAKAESGYPAQAAPNKPENSPDPKPAPREIPDITKDSPQPNAKDPVKAGQGDSNQGRK